MEGIVPAKWFLYPEWSAVGLGQWLEQRLEWWMERRRPMEWRWLEWWRLERRWAVEWRRASGPVAGWWRSTGAVNRRPRRGQLQTRQTKPSQDGWAFLLAAVGCAAPVFLGCVAL